MFAHSCAKLCGRRSSAQIKRPGPNYFPATETFSLRKNQIKRGLTGMKQRRALLNIIGAVAVALTAGCTTTQTSVQDKESMLVASGFKVITPKNATQQQ